MSYSSHVLAWVRRINESLWQSSFFMKRKKDDSRDPNWRCIKTKSIHPSLSLGNTFHQLGTLLITSTCLCVNVTVVTKNLILPVNHKSHYKISQRSLSFVQDSQKGIKATVHVVAHRYSEMRRVKANGSSVYISEVFVQIVYLCKPSPTPSSCTNRNLASLHIKHFRTLWSSIDFQ